MAEYDYRKGKERVENILDNTLDVVEQDKLPKDESFTFNNGYYSIVTSVFVDIRSSTKLFAHEDKKQVSKVIRSFTSEVIEILRKDDNLREIGIRGDCVYAIYTTSEQSDVFEIASKTFYINSFMKMLNKLLEDRSLPKILVGIGMATAKELVVKAGREGSGINNKVWIGKAVTGASNLSSLGNKQWSVSQAYSECSFNNFIEQLEQKNPDKTPRNWFSYHYDVNIGGYYTANVIYMDFDKWIDAGLIN